MRLSAVQEAKAVLDTLVQRVHAGSLAIRDSDRRFAAASEGAERAGVRAGRRCYYCCCTARDRGGEQYFSDHQLGLRYVGNTVYGRRQDPECRGQNAAMLTPTKNPA